MASDLFDDPRLTAMGLLVEAYEGISARISEVHAAHGLSGNEFDVLIRLARSPGRQLRMADLAAQTALSTSGITRVIDRMERAGLVERAACPGDRRGSLAVLTRSGEDRLAADVPPLLDAIDTWFTGRLSAEELDAFLTGLRKLREVVRPRATAGADAPDASPADPA
ncbi:MarR family transcriptional regulator [Haloechinothrix sp. YIM 98757]|uniref:MarR family transcriptional regulator n=1 Tax=Haloechinothrix aidingensis TaxID=2752311 RepID=A0A838ABK7_9PSEU|nr:MarR family transcriptional regulator [Haloechinothrix aidingensis]MBA0126624.1 MarR family transcriptional regulator [Haloechinothrix aidingensis]